MTTDRTFDHSRVIAASPEEVFARFAHAGMLANWWGPEGFVSTFDEFEFRSGGAWRFVMHAPDGQQYPMACRFRQVVPNEKVVIENLAQGHHFVLTVTLVRGWRQGTTVYWQQVFDTAEEHDRVASVVRPANEQNLRRLAAAVMMPRNATAQALAEAADRAVRLFKAKTPVDVDCPSCGLLLSVRYAEYSDVFAVSCPCMACRRELPGVREHPPTPFFRGDVVMNGRRHAVGMAPRLEGWGGISLCNFSRVMSLEGRRTYEGRGPHISVDCSDDDFVAAAVPGRPVAFQRTRDKPSLGQIQMNWGYGAVDTGPHERQVQSLELSTTVTGSLVRFEFRGHAGPATGVREPDTLLGSGPVDFVAAFELTREELPIFAPDAAVRARLEAQLFP